MISLDDLLKTWENDCEIDSTEPGRELLKIPKLHSKYLKIMIEANMLLKKIDNDLAVFKKIKYKYYCGDYNTDKEFLKEKGWEPFKIILKNDIGTYIAADDDLIKLTDKKSYYEQIVKACELILGELKQRGYSLSKVVDWEKFVNGG